MKRSAFLKSIIAALGLSAVPVAFLKQYDKYYLLQCFVRGFRYYQGPNLLNEMHEGDMLELVREPKNEHDEFAIALHFNSKKIGFVPAESNEMLARLIDIGVPQLMAEITHLKTEAANWEQVAIAIYVLKEKVEGSKINPEALCLTQLETPHYHSIKLSDNSIARFECDEDYEFDKHS